MLKRRGKAGTYYVRFTAPDGREVYRSTGTSDRRLAEEYEARLRSDLWRQSRLGEKPRRTWQDAVVRYLEARGQFASLPELQRNLRWLHPHLGGLYLDEISEDVLERIALARKAEPARKSQIAARRDKRPRPGDDKPTSAGTVNRMLEHVRAILRAALARKWLDRVPVFPMLDEGTHDPRALSDDEVRALFDELAPHLRPAYLFALATGLRASNVLGLRWDQVSMGQRLVSVPASRAKARRAIPVPLNAAAMLVIQQQMAARDADADCPFVFPGPSGDRITRASNKGWRGARRRAGVDARWHDLRHTWASRHARAGTPLLALKELGGWSSLAMVQRYSHFTDAGLAGFAENAAGGLPEIQPAAPSVQIPGSAEKKTKAKRAK